jgi:hypothetical protein
VCLVTDKHGKDSGREFRRWKLFSFQSKIP